MSRTAVRNLSKCHVKLRCIINETTDDKHELISLPHSIYVNVFVYRNHINEIWLIAARYIISSIASISFKFPEHSIVVMESLRCETTETSIVFGVGFWCTAAENKAVNADQANCYLLDRFQWKIHVHTSSAACFFLFGKMHVYGSSALKC